MEASEYITLNRDCDAIQIPSGAKIKLAKGTEVRITQSLGGNYTVLTDSGNMVRISSEDADAVGKAADSPGGKQNEVAVGVATPSLEKMVWDQLKTCYDPEIPINIVDLGLVYECRLSPLSDGASCVDVKMTVTAPGCGMGDVLKRDAEEKIRRLPGVKETHVELVWDPPWDQSKMSDAAKLKLGLM